MKGPVCGSHLGPQGLAFQGTVGSHAYRASSLEGAGVSEREELRLRKGKLKAGGRTASGPDQ